MNMKRKLTLWVHGRLTCLGIAFLILLAGPMTGLGAQSASDQVSSAAKQVGQSLEEAGKSAADTLDQLWQKVDAQRLKNRTPDEIVAWAIMGLLVGGVLAQTLKINRFAAFGLGLVGAFVGGVVAHITQLNLGLGPVLIRYEDLLLSLAGGLLLVFLGKLFLKRKSEKA